MNLKKFEPIFFKIIQMQSVSILPICVYPHASLSFYCIAFTLFNSFKLLLQCFILLFGHFGDILHDIAPLNPFTYICI